MNVRFLGRAAADKPSGTFESHCLRFRPRGQTPHPPRRTLPQRTTCLSNALPFVRWSRAASTTPERPPPLSKSAAMHALINVTPDNSALDPAPPYCTTSTLSQRPSFYRCCGRAFCILHCVLYCRRTEYTTDRPHPADSSPVLETAVRLPGDLWLRHGERSV